MKGARFVRLYPSDWRSGCIGMTLEEEGLYIRVIAHFWETGVRLPLDDVEAASRVMLDVRMYRRVKAKLIARGKLHVGQDGIFNPRCELEYRLAQKAAQAGMGSPREAHDRQHADGGVEAGRRQLAGPEVLTDIEETSAGSLGEVSENFIEKHNDFNGPIKSHSKETEVSTPLPPLRGDDELPRHVKRVENWDQAFAAPSGVEMRGSAVVLLDSNRTFWLDQFGGSAPDLDLALMQAAGEIRPNSRTHPLEAQVSRVLARIVQERRDRDRRYQAATERNKAAPRPSNDYAERRSEAGRALIANLMGNAA